VSERPLLESADLGTENASCSKRPQPVLYSADIHESMRDGHAERRVERACAVDARSGSLARSTFLVVRRSGENTKIARLCVGAGFVSLVSRS
jgi:hypothetical protein